MARVPNFRGVHPQLATHCKFRRLSSPVFFASRTILFLAGLNAMLLLQQQQQQQRFRDSCGLVVRCCVVRSAESHGPSSSSSATFRALLKYASGSASVRGGDIFQPLVMRSTRLRSSDAAGRTHPLSASSSRLEAVDSIPSGLARSFPMQSRRVTNLR